MRNTLLIALILTANLVFAQNSPVDFESGGFGANWTWTVFENETNPPLEIVANPMSGGLNQSATVAKFTALLGGNPWAGCESQHGTDIGSFSLTPSSSTIKIMVWKSVISDVGIKLVEASSASLGEIKIANTQVNQWEEISFNFSSMEGIEYDQIVIFPDFQDRDSTNVIYFDNITFGDGSVGLSDLRLTSFELSPNPATEELTISAAHQIESLRIHNILGEEELAIFPMNNLATIDLTKLKQGVYFATSVINGVRGSKRFIKN